MKQIHFIHVNDNDKHSIRYKDIFMELAWMLYIDSRDNFINNNNNNNNTVVLNTI